jgi:hypothetical protein
MLIMFNLLPFGTLIDYIVLYKFRFNGFNIMYKLTNSFTIRLSTLLNTANTSLIHNHKSLIF